MNNTYYGIIMILIGIFLFISGFKRSEFFIYKLMFAKSKKLWGKDVHMFYQISGLLVIVAGIILASGLI